MLDATVCAPVLHRTPGSVSAADVPSQRVTALHGLPPDAALYELGLLHLRDHDYERARQRLQRLMDDYPASPYTESARQRLSEIS